MFEVLVASGAHSDLKISGLTTSLVTHLLVGALAITATRAALEAPRVALPEEVMLLIPKAPEPAPPPRPEKAATIVNLVDPPPQGFQTVAALTEIPDVIPPVDLNERPFDPRDFTGRGVEGGVFNGVVGGTGPVGIQEIYEATTDLAGFEPAAVLHQPMPEYPAGLVSVGLDGRVLVQFVIDSAGAVEPASFRVLESSNALFESAARKAITASKFRPARVGKVPVRQLTRQSVRFVATQ